MSTNELMMSSDAQQQMRQHMVDRQLRPLNISDERVLSVLATVPRELFLADNYSQLAYADYPFEIGHGCHTFTPITVGRILQAIALTAQESVLEVGTGCGYLTACLAQLARTVDSVDLHQDFSEQAAERLAQLNISNVTLHTADGTELWETNHRFDVTFMGAALPEVAEQHFNRTTLGGRVFAFLQQPHEPIAHATLFTRTPKNIWQKDILFEAHVDQMQTPMPVADYTAS